jgi:N-formylglutamate amidohydrolase
VTMAQNAQYHLKINKKIDENIETYWWSIVIDNHDTWVLDMWSSEELDRFDEWGFPLITLGTLDWASCNEEIVKYYAERIEFHLWIKPLINKPYKWWYVTKKHREEKRTTKNICRKIFSKN